MSFLDKFCEIFELYSFGNVYYGRLTAHALLGQILKTCKIYFGPIFIDPRISIFIIQPSGTGKSTPWDFVNRVGTEGGIKVSDIDETSDAALVGTIEEQEVVDSETKRKYTAYNKVTGLLGNADLLHYDEGSMLLNLRPYSSNTLTWFQKALNPIGSHSNICARKLAHGKIVEVAPTCSLVITSHPVEGVMEQILNKGFFQRVVLYPRSIPINERRDLEYLRADRLGDRTYTEPDIKLLGELLQTIRAKYNGGEITFDERVKPVVKAKIKALYDLIATAHEKVKEIMATFIPRYNNYLYIFAFHHCCNRFGKKVVIQDINYAYGLVYVLFRELMSWVEETADFYKLGSKDYSYLRSAYNVFRQIRKDTPEGYVMKHNFMKKCSDQWKVSLRTVERYFNKFKGFGKLQEYERRRVKYVKLVI